MFRKISLILIAVLLLTVSGGLFAQQNAQELRFGVAVSGNLSSYEEIWYIVRAAESCLLVVETTGNTDTYLEIYDAQRNLLLENDDGGNGYNAKVEIFAERGINYLVKLSAYSDDYGPFRIMSSYTPLSDAVELSLGSTLSGNISPGQKLLYSIRTAEAGIYSVETTGNTDTYLDAYDSSFIHIGYNDDFDYDDYNARIEIFAEANKTYYFVLRGYDNETSGPYRIFSSFESMAIVDANNTSRSTAAVLVLGEAIPVFFTAPGQSRWYVYQAARSLTLQVQTRGNMDTLLYLYNSNGNFLDEDDDSGDNYNAFISSRLNAGTYYIEVKGYGGETGRCTLHAEIR